MSDPFDLVKELEPAVAALSQAQIDHRRAVLMAVIGDEQAQDDLSAPITRSVNEPSAEHKWGRLGARRRFGSVLIRRRPWGRVVLVCALAGIAAGLGIVFVGPQSSERRPSAVVQLAAVRFLDKAAASVAQQPDSSPLPGQFVYSETEGPDGTVTDTWLSVDGSKQGLSQTAGTAGSRSLGPSCTISQAEATGCLPSIGYYPDLPTDSDAVLAYLNKIKLVDTANNPSYDSLPGWENNVIGKGCLVPNADELPAPRPAGGALPVDGTDAGFPSHSGHGGRDWT